ncbi:MAG: transketolase C-terminal domain-containing protein, partial [Candidatus Cloacimonetes bacterium]|nr:transketolase C-terminal domain-containing protein [Candidatus Cloacimonadota bacterium]
ALSLAIDTANILKRDGCSPLIVNLRSVKPLDENVLHALGKACSHIFTFENNSIIGGTGGRIAQILSESQARVVNFGYPDYFIGHGDTQKLKEEIGFTASHLAEAVRQHL